MLAMDKKSAVDKVDRWCAFAIAIAMAIATRKRRRTKEKKEKAKRKTNRSIDNSGTATFHAFDRIPEKYIEHEIILVLIGKLVAG